MLAQFIMPVFLTHYLSETNYGLYSQFYLLLTFLGTIFGFGIQSNLYYFYPRTTKYERTNLVWNNLAMMFVAGILGIVFLSVPFFRQLLMGNGEIQNYWWLIAICILFYIPTNLITTIAIVAKDKRLATFYPPVDILMKILIIIPIALVYDSIIAIFWGVTLFQSMECVFIYVCISCKYGTPHSANLFNYTLIKEQLSYALPFGGAVLINTICQQFDKVVSVSYLSANEYAVYALAFFGIPGIMQIYDSIAQVNVTNMAKAYYEDDKPGVLALYKDFVRQTLSFSLPLILIGIVFAPQLIEFAFSSKYAATVPYFRTYLLTFVIAMIGSGTILRAVGRTKLSFKAFLITAIIYVPLCIGLIHYFGINGAITSAFIGFCMPRFFQAYFEKKWAQISIRGFLPWRDIFKISTISLLLLIPIILLNVSFNLSIWIAFILLISYIFSVYALQIKYDVFIISHSVLCDIMKRIRLKFKLKTCRNI